MTPPVWCAERAADFWDRAGPPPPFPRDLRAAIAFAVPLTVVDLPAVGPAAVRGWFRRNGVPVPLAEPDRPLRACLVAWRGAGFAFVDAGDDPAERAFSVAHELAHFLRDYLHPRETAVRRLGPAAAEVLDGARPPTPDERLHAVLRHVAVRPFTHLLRRGGDGRPLTPAEREAEVAADRLAFELLAPAGAVGDGGDLVARLVGVFGLPPGPAARYAAVLAPDPPPAGPLGRILATLRKGRRTPGERPEG